MELFANKGVMPPSVEYITRDDLLLVTAWTSTGGAVTLHVDARILTPDGRIVPCGDKKVVTGTGTSPDTLTLQLPEGFLVSLSMWASLTARGACFAMAQLQRGAGTSDTCFPSTLCSGYVTMFRPVCYPNGACEDSKDGRGLFRIVNITTPAAGAEISYTVPQGVNWGVRAMHFTFIADANAATRTPTLFIDDGASTSHVIYESHGLASPIANQTHKFSGYPAADTYDNFNSPWAFMLPQDLNLPSGARFRTVTSNIQVGDAYSSIYALVEQWIGF